MKNNTKKQEIIDAFAKVIERQGIEGASLGAVAQEVGIPQSLIFHYFLNKEDLLNQLADKVTALCLKSYEKALPKRGAYTKQSFVYFTEYILEVHKHRRKSVSPRLYFSLVYLMPRQKQVMQSFIDLTGRLIDLITGHISRFQQTGVISPPSPRLAAHTLLCLTDGILCYDALIPHEERQAFVEQQKQIFFNYVNFKNPCS